MKHIKLFENVQGMENETSLDMKGNKPYVYCITGDNGSAVGMLDPKEEKMLFGYVQKNPGMLTIEKFTGEMDGDFVVLTVDGEWKFVEVGEIYRPEEGDKQFLIAGYGQMMAGFAGAQTDWVVDTPSKIIPEL